MANPSAADAPKPARTKTQLIATRGGVVAAPQKPRRRTSNPAEVIQNSDDLLREQVGGFTDFLREYAVVGLAVGFIIGQEANAVVKQLVASFIEPWLQVLFGKNLSEAQVTVHHGTDPIEVAWGQFVYIFIEFLVVAVTIYVVVKLLRLDKLKKKKEEAAAAAKGKKK